MKGKSVSCIKFHPKKAHLIAVSLIDKLNFDERTLKMGKSFDSSVLILNHADPNSIKLNYLLSTPIEVTVIEWHPEHTNILIGGAINGQVVAWDIGSADHRIGEAKLVSGKIKMPDEEEDKT